ncbi:inorganic diphosphatase [Hymenobacter chitinivorans]|uniref:inorganic diphosphatase n=1 Tax=Hymenobacter chitinivorans DSM 11115 TaxID=1121954 RepID=A0A2M9B9I1_9BACT|nr:inorganic diphosphatase [Hymenobacter chitinivorans]PJJ54594.1 inorganic pyrophosphatase [Hymenobacter chitinivorans DSM 11115]
MNSALFSLPAWHQPSGHLHVVIETPKGSRNKFAYDPETQLFKLKGTLPEGSSFPYDFGFVPSTLGPDGDPLDVLVLMDAPAFAGCLLEARLIGAIEAEQTENGHTERNDRLLAVSASSRQHQHLHDTTDLPAQLLQEIEHFFRSYNEAAGRQFVPVRRVGAKRARTLVEHAQQAFRKAAP